LDQSLQRETSLRLTVTSRDAIQVVDGSLQIDSFAAGAVGLPDYASPIPDACYGHGNESRSFGFVAGEPRQRQGLLFSFCNGKGNRYVLQFVWRGPWRKIEPIGAFRRRQVLLVWLRLAVLPLLPFGMIAAQSAGVCVGLTWPVVGDQNPCSIPASLLADDFTAVVRIHAAKLGGIGDLARDP